ncbi:unnamed protein product [Rotaria sp. Silwood1]|nr:unnamed protein product [Rotaria sp. Silwood1]CAF3764973.1 unnamed protein product [Rotaria sp. Silwood1]
MLSFIVDEIDQIIRSKEWIHDYIANGWNWVDLAGILCYLIAFITRLFVVESVFTASKVDRVGDRQAEDFQKVKVQYSFCLAS